MGRYSLSNATPAATTSNVEQVTTTQWVIDGSDLRQKYCMQCTHGSSTI